MTLAELLTYLIILVAFPLNLYVTFRLWSQTRRSATKGALRDRAVVATALTCFVAIAAAIFFNNDTVPPYLGADVTKIATRVAVLGLSVVPAVYWLRLYRSTRPQ